MKSVLEGDFSLTCWYLNQRRLQELVGPAALAKRLDGLQGLDDHQLQLATLAAYRSAAIGYIKEHDIKPLGQQLLRRHRLEGQLFTHYSNFWFKGLANIDMDSSIRRQDQVASGYTKLDGFKPKLRLEFNFHPDHLTSNSAWGEMSGQARKFFFGIIQSSSESRLTALPYIVGDVIVRGDGAAFPSAGYWKNHRELYVDDIGSFDLVADYTPKLTEKSLDVLKTISEEQVKLAFAEIIGEPTVPKDWGGERSDLFSTNLRIDGRRISTAFAFKGPAKFRPMTMAELGKNGDQIDRLFSEPADLLVLQHCHEVTPPVRAAMRAYAERVSSPRLFCIINGYDTLRVLGAYRKCGLTPPRALTKVRRRA